MPHPTVQFRELNSASDPLLYQASPVNHIPPQAPPFLVLHGEQDSAVPVEQSRLLVDRLKDAGIEAELVIVKNANHNFKPTGGKSSEWLRNFLTPDSIDPIALIAKVNNVTRIDVK